MGALWPGRKVGKARVRTWPGRPSPGLLGKAGLGDSPGPFQFLRVCDQWCLKMMTRPAQDWLDTLEVITL